MSLNKKCEQATFGMGCFWHSEEVFRKVRGVRRIAVGFMGGNVPSPTYEQVYKDSTGHVEVVHIAYDPAEVSYEELLRVFWENHNPTTSNRQGPDTGTRYRSIIFFHNLVQEELAKTSKENLEKSGKWHNLIVTEIIPASEFYRAEEYHQRYLEKRGLGSCPA